MRSVKLWTESCSRCSFSPRIAPQTSLLKLCAEETRGAGTGSHLTAGSASELSSPSASAVGRCRTSATAVPRPLLLPLILLCCSFFFFFAYESHRAIAAEQRAQMLEEKTARMVELVKAERARMAQAQGHINSAREAELGSKITG